MICKVCGGSLKKILSYNEMPAASWRASDTEYHTLVRLDIYECLGCGLVQLPMEPVSYYKTALRSYSSSKQVSDLRVQQKQELRNSYRCNNIIDITSYPIEGGPYDGFLFLQYIEHLPDPKEALRNLHTQLSDWAVGLIEVPNFDMILKEKLFLEFTRDHLFYFTRQTLNMLVLSSGFDIISSYTGMDDYILGLVVRKRSPLDMQGLKSEEEILYSSLYSFIGKSPIVIWGASHQTFALVHTLGIQEMVECVVDSNPEKQGNCVPGTDIPIVSPWFLKVNPTNKILVVAGGYTREIVDSIKAKSNIRVGYLQGVKLIEC